MSSNKKSDLKCNDCGHEFKPFGQCPNSTDYCRVCYGHHSKTNWPNHYCETCETCHDKEYKCMAKCDSCKYIADMVEKAYRDVTALSEQYAEDMKEIDYWTEQIVNQWPRFGSGGGLYTRWPNTLAHM